MAARDWKFRRIRKLPGQDSNLRTQHLSDMQIPA
jgi:hypothetical protein